MLDDEELLEITNKTFRLSIPIGLYRMRNEFCLHDGKMRPGWTCPMECPIFRHFITGVCPVIRHLTVTLTSALL